jgi:hypothetical protein
VSGRRSEDTRWSGGKDSRASARARAGHDAGARLVARKTASAPLAVPHPQAVKRIRILQTEASSALRISSRPLSYSASSTIFDRRSTGRNRDHKTPLNFDGLQQFVVSHKLLDAKKVYRFIELCRLNFPGKLPTFQQPGWSGRPAIRRKDSPPVLQDSPSYSGSLASLPAPASAESGPLHAPSSSCSPGASSLVLESRAQRPHHIRGGRDGRPKHLLRRPAH